MLAVSCRPKCGNPAIPMPPYPSGVLTNVERAATPPGETYTAADGKVYEWNGQAWKLKSPTR